MEKYLAFLKENGAELALVIDPKTVATAAWTVHKCRYGCGGYGKSLCCPPHTPTWKETQEMLDCYNTAILYRCAEMAQVTPLAVAAVRELFLDDYYKAIAFGGGSCKKCENCNLVQCKFPRETLPSMEASGIDVFATVRANGLELHTLRKKDERAGYFGLLLVK